MAAVTITRALVERSIILWLLLRLFLLALVLSASVSGGRGTVAMAVLESLYFSSSVVPVMLVSATVLSEVDVLRRHERVLLGNLGVSLPFRLGIALGIALAGEILFAIATAILLP